MCTEWKNKWIIQARVGVELQNKCLALPRKPNSHCSPPPETTLSSPMYVRKDTWRDKQEVLELFKAQSEGEMLSSCGGQRKRVLAVGGSLPPLFIWAFGSRKQISDIIKLIRTKRKKKTQKLGTGYGMTVPLYNLIEEMYLGLPRQSIIHELNVQASITWLDALIH